MRGFDRGAADTINLTLATGLAPTVPTYWWFADFIGPKLKEYSHAQIELNAGR